ncbi:MAG: hypothetical protein LJE94_04685 [Deltaproteobacteria bacterium]|nr:hypothetical protein [Deltaproteobacteria bacterium]
MKNEKDLFDYDSLAFFGRVNASISHELKNIMAIISETAGLLTDLSEMASTGTPVDPDMLKNSAGSIIEEIQRAFKTIRQMNRFSHSVDAPIVSVDLVELLDLICQLANYLSFCGKIRLTPWDGDPPEVQTCPFALQAIVYEIVVQHFKNEGPSAELDIDVQPLSNTGWVIGIADPGSHGLQDFTDNRIEKAATSIGVAIKGEGGHLKLNVPLTIQTGLAKSEAG